jgi:hypothetical protein
VIQLFRRVLGQTRLSIVLAGLAGATGCVGDAGDPDELALESTAQAATTMTCTSTVGVGGSVGSTTDTNAYVVGVVSTAVGLDISAPNFGNTKPFVLGTGITASGAFGSATGFNTINQITSAFGSDTVRLIGAQNGQSIVATIQLSHGRFGYIDRSFSHVMAVASSGVKTLIFTGLELSGAGTGTGSLEVYGECTLTPQVTGSSGTIAFSATAPGATTVKYYVDGVLAATTSAPFNASFDSRTLPNGSHTLLATASDASGNQAMSAPQTFSTSNTTPTATATITPAGTVSGNVTLGATGSTTPTSVQFLVDNVARGTDSSSPFSMTFNTRLVGNGTHTLVAKATIAGGIVLSPPVTFTTSNDLIAPQIGPLQFVSLGTGAFGADVTDASPGVIDHVDINIGTVPTIRLMAAPFSRTLDSRFIASATSINMTVAAFDLAGNVARRVQNIAISNVTARDVEPSTLTQPVQLGTAGVKAVGTLGIGDEDFFRATVAAGRTITLHMDCSNFSCTSPAANFNLFLLTTSGTQLAQSSGSGMVEALSFTNTGTAAVDYLIKVNNGGANSGQSYTVTVDR